MRDELLNRERRLRYKAQKKHLILSKGYRYENWNGFYYDKYLGYMVIDVYTGFVISGCSEYSQYELTIEEAESYVHNYGIQENINE